MTHTVFLTGASGYIAKHIAVALLSAGHSVVGSVRQIERSEEIRAAVLPHVNRNLGTDQLRFAAADLTQDAGWSEAMQGCDVVMHTASPFPLTQPKSESDLIQPAVEGTRRVLTAAQAASINRVVMTSSILAITEGTAPAKGTPYTETDWTDSSARALTAYAKSKTLAERAAWAFVESEAPDLALTAINPGFVLGPPLDSKFGTSIRVIERMLLGKDPMVPQIGFATVDVRDVALAHLRALERPESAGKRYVVSDRFLWFQEIAETLKAAHPDRKIATRVAPNWLLRAVALFDPKVKPVVPNLGQRREVSSARARDELGLNFRDARDSVSETAAFLVRHKLV